MKVGDKVTVVKEGIDDQFNGDSGEVIAIINDSMIIVKMDVIFLSQPIAFHRNQLTEWTGEEYD